MASKHTKKGAAVRSALFAKQKPVEQVPKPIEKVPAVVYEVPVSSVPDVPTVPAMYHILCEDQWLQLWLPLRWTSDRNLALASDYAHANGMIQALARRKRMSAIMVPVDQPEIPVQ